MRLRSNINIQLLTSSSTTEINARRYSSIVRWNASCSFKLTGTGGERKRSISSTGLHNRRTEETHFPGTCPLHRWSGTSPSSRLCVPADHRARHRARSRSPRAVVSIRLLSDHPQQRYGHEPGSATRESTVHYTCRMDAGLPQPSSGGLLAFERRSRRRHRRERA